ncbi:MAG: DinB family protein [Chloroflexi bacterium]|nr:DinB family protein [Chloroflexota bacterium]
MSGISPDLFTAQLPISGPILRALTADLSPQQAHHWRDGSDGWNAIEVIAHLRDYERFFVEWAQLMQNEDVPTLPRYDPDELARERRYDEQELAEVLVEWEESRAASIDFYASLHQTDYQRRGIHPRRGAWSIGHGLALQVLHDVTHFEQLAKIRAGAGR